MGHLIERTGDQVKMFFGDLWFSHVERLTRSVALQQEVHVFNLTFHLL